MVTSVIGTKEGNFGVYVSKYWPDVILALSFGLAADIYNTICLCWLLYHSKGDFKEYAFFFLVSLLYESCSHGTTYKGHGP